MLPVVSFAEISSETEVVSPLCSRPWAPPRIRAPSRLPCAEIPWEENVNVRTTAPGKLGQSDDLGIDQTLRQIVDEPGRSVESPPMPSGKTHRARQSFILERDDRNLAMPAPPESLAQSIQPCFTRCPVRWTGAPQTSLRAQALRLRARRLGGAIQG